jgi:hypothetical protein
MQKIFEYNEYKFSLYDVSTSIIYNNENLKNKILNGIRLEDGYIIDSRMISTNESVGNFLKSEDFDMSLINKFNLSNLLSKRFNDLFIEDKLYLKIIIFITKLKSKFIFDDVLTYISDKNKKIIFKYLINKNIKFINFTSDIEEVLFTNYLIVLSNDQVALEGKTSIVLKEEKLLKRLGFSLPVIYDLSLQLKAYGIIDNVYYDVDKLVHELWS